MTYTVGFAFTHDLRMVALIHKNRGPTPVIGKLNGIGGKLELDESPVQCQRREFLEETGVDITEERWKHTVTLRKPEWMIFFFRTDLTPEEATALRSMTDEKVELLWVAGIQDYWTVRNLRWLIPMQLDTHLKWPVEIEETSP
jgi:8-oxo-dGTP diphosphatase